jgi:hypothetical protein
MTSDSKRTPRTLPEVSPSAAGTGSTNPEQTPPARSIDITPSPPRSIEITPSAASPPTPRASEAAQTGERRITDPAPPPSGARVSATGERAAGRESRVTGDTLLSAPAPADAREIEIDDRFNDHSQRIAEIEQRVEALGRAFARLQDTRSKLPPWWVWVVFLLSVALAWQLIARHR